MQKMMIQDTPTRLNNNGSVVTRGEKASAGKPFGKVLGDQQVTADEAGAEQVAGTKVSAKKQDKKPEHQTQADAVLLFMAALMDQTASNASSADITADTTADATDLVAGAAQAQKLIDAWLNSTSDGSGGSDKLLTKALDALGLTTAVGQDQAGLKTEPSEVLSDKQIAELKELMTVMLAKAQLPQPPAGRPLSTELQQLLAKFHSASGENPVGETRSQVGQVAAVAGPGANVDFQLQAAGRTAKAADGHRTAELVPDLAGQDHSAIKVEDARPGGVRPESAAQKAAGLQENQMAQLLKPRGEQPTLHEQQSDKNAAKAEATQAIAAGSANVAVKVDPQLETVRERASEVVKTVTSLSSDNTLPQSQGLHQAGPALSQNSAVTAPAVKMMQLPSGLQLAENQVVGQIVSHLAGSTDGESGRIRLRLHPAELGSVRLDLIVEGDRVRAHLQAQTQQVQEVLGRHLPQLRDALQQHGLTVDEFRVDVQSGQDQSASQNFTWQQSQQHEQSSRHPLPDNDWQQPDMILPLQQVMQTASGSISLRV